MTLTAGTDHPAVSVVIPFRSRIEWLREAVRSVLDQTWDDFEVIVVDDGSDETGAPSLGFDEPRMRYIRQDHKGRSAARNNGIALSRGSLVAFLDSDDLFLPTKLERQVAMMRANPGCLMSHTSYERVGAEGRGIDVVASGRCTGVVYPRVVLRCPIATPTVMVRREVFDQGARFEESLDVGEDIVLWARIARMSPVLGIDEPLTRVRVHGANAASDREAQIAAQMYVVEHIIRKDSGLPWAVRRELESSSCIDIAYSFFRLKKPALLMRYLVRAIIAWPVNPRFLEVLAYAVRLVVDRVLGKQHSDDGFLASRSDMRGK